MDTFIKIGNLDLRTLKNDELDCLINELSQEREQRRKNEELTQDWNELVNAILRYSKKYGGIDISTEAGIFHIKNGYDFNWDIIGQISLY